MQQEKWKDVIRKSNFQLSFCEVMQQPRCKIETSSWYLNKNLNTCDVQNVDLLMSSVLCTDITFVHSHVITEHRKDV